MNRSECNDWCLKRSFSIVNKSNSIKKKSEKLEKLKKDMFAFVRKIDDSNEDVTKLSEEQRLELYYILGKKNIPKKKKKKKIKK